MENNFKRFLSLVVAMVMVFGMIPATVFATEANTTVEYVAEISETSEQYETLAGAVVAANELDTATVTLLKDVTLGEKLTVSGNVTIEGNYTITRDDAYTGTLFTVNAGAILTLDNDLTIDGGNEWSYIKATPELDMANGAGTYVGNHITPAEGGVNATGHLIVNGGTLNVNDVTIQNSYSTNGVSVIDAGANSVTTIDGATIQNIAANRSGAVAYIGGADAVLTIKGETRITGNFGTGNGGIIQNYGQGTTVNMEGGRIDNNHVGKSGTLYASYSSNANKINTFNMSGGIITKNVMEGYGPVYIHTNTVWNMTGGEISENTSFLPSYVRNANPAGIMSGGSIVNNKITGLTYSNGYYVTHPDVRLNGLTAITGGSYTQDVSEWLGTDLELAYNAETGTYTVVPASKAVARIESIDEEFETLADAIAAANKLDNATVTLLKDVTLGEKLTVTGNVTIEGEYTITRDDAYTKTLFTVNAGATLTLDGDLTIDGGNNWAFDEEGFMTALYDNTVSSSGLAFVTPEAGAPCATAPMFDIMGTVLANDVTVQNHLSTVGSNDGSRAVFKLSNGAVLTMTGAKITHCATGDASTVAGLNSGSIWTINDGTVISGNYGGRNGAMCRNNNSTIIMNGGSINHNYSVNANGSIFMMYGSGNIFQMMGGEICTNYSAKGGNGRTSAIYLHGSGVMKMTGGSICHNVGAGYGGIDTNQSSGSSLTITAGNVYGNVSTGGNPHHDINWEAANPNHYITGGCYSQDVSKYCAEGFAAVLEYNEELKMNLYHVVEKPDTAVTVTVNDVTYVEGNPVPTEFTYTTNVEVPELTIEYTLDGDVINATVAEMDGYVFTVVPGKLIAEKAVMRVYGKTSAKVMYFSDFNKGMEYAVSQNDYVPIYLLDNIELTETVVIADDRTNKMELQSDKIGVGTYKLTSSFDGPMFKIESGALSVKNIIINAYGDAFYVNGGTLELNNHSEGKQFIEVTSQTGNCVYIRGGNVNVNGAKLTSLGEYPAIQGNGNYSGNVTITKWNIGSVLPEISAPNSDMAIYWPGEGKLTIEMGTITGDTALYAKSGTINISGGEFYGTGEKADFVHSSNGSYATGDAVVIENCKDAAYETPVVSVTGGTFVSDNAKAIAVYNCNESVTLEHFISGGTFNTDVDDALVVEGMFDLPNAKREWWNIYDGLLTVDGVWYDSFDEAKSHIKKNSEIVLYADVVNTYNGGDVAKDYKFPSNGGTITMELNGFTFTSAQSASSKVTTITIQGGTTLRITDSVGGGKIVFENNSYPCVLAPKSNLYIQEGIQFIGAMQWNMSNGFAGNYHVGDKTLIGMDGVYAVNAGTRIQMNENGDWTMTMGKLTMTADDATLANNTLTINKNCSIDLNGNDLTAQNITVFGNLIDTADGAGSVAAEKLWFNGHDNGGYLPIAESENVYRLFDTDVLVKGSKDTTYNGKKAVIYGGGLEFKNAEAYELLLKAQLDGLMDLDVSITGSETDSESFSVTTDILKSYLEAAYAQLKAGKPITKGVNMYIVTENGLVTGDVLTGSFGVELVDLGIVMNSDVHTHTVK